jgi:hypothetical protein
MICAQSKGKYIVPQCQTATPAKKHFGKSKKLPIQSRSTARNFSDRLNCVASYARQKSDSPPSHPSQATSSRSSKPEKFCSRFLARFTFASTSVTVNFFLPIDLRPEPLRFPPRLFIENILIFSLTRFENICILSNSQSRYA